jgi:glycerophosphoryl diester phosphodiesterase
LERIAHRGAKREFTENTLPAFARAFERTADAVELDVHTTRDRVVVVHHDARLSAVLGRGVEIATADWEQIRAVDLGGGIGIPRLVDVLNATPSDRTVYVELKGERIEEAVVTVIRESDARCAIHSFDHEAIARVRELAPEIPRGILFEDRSADIVSAMQRTGARDVWPHWKRIDAALVNRIHDTDGRVIAWTVNDRAVAERLMSIGVDGLCGDDVRLFDGL